MTRHTAVSVNNDLPPGQATIPHRSANNELSGWVDVVFGVI